MVTQSLYEIHKLDPDKQDIRLVKFQAADSHREPCSSLGLDMKVFPLAEAPPFRALSYVWGDPNITEPVLVDGHSLPVTKNLLAALGRIHKHCDEEYDWPEPPAFLWIDAIFVQPETVWHLLGAGFRGENGGERYGVLNGLSRTLPLRFGRGVGVRIDEEYMGC
jgi:hypothetical protein